MNIRQLILSIFLIAAFVFSATDAALRKKRQFGFGQVGLPLPMAGLGGQLGFGG